MTKLDNSNWTKLKKQIVTKLKNSNSDIAKRLKLGQNSKIQIVKKKILKKNNCDKTKKNSNWGKTQNLNLGQNKKTQFLTKLKKIKD